jgi:hypothetical protein
VSLSLVGMLRPPGFGNLQGFVGYATSLLGLPLDLLLGVQNDGDSPEVSKCGRNDAVLSLLWVYSAFRLAAGGLKRSKRRYPAVSVLLWCGALLRILLSLP